MVRGVQTFRDYFRDYTDSFVIIGGVACEEWLLSQGLRFRATRDVDMVLIVEGRSAEFLKHLWEFINAHGYAASSRSDGTKTYYRFENPTPNDVPSMIELFATIEFDFGLTEGQTIIPIAGGESIPSLSAILMDSGYYDLIRNAASPKDGLPLIGPDALIPLKARAHLDLAKRKDTGESVSNRDIRKHRNDVFLLASTLPNTLGRILPGPIKTDLAAFLERFPEDSNDWTAILNSVRTSLGSVIPTPGEFRSVLKTYFGL